MIDSYFDQVRAVIAVTLDNESLRPTDRLKAYFDAITQLLQAASWRYGCLVGNMALEASEHSDRIRDRLSTIFVDWTLPFGRVISDAQRDGDLRADLDATETGAALLEAWHGAMLRMKIDRSPAALERFRRVTLPALLSGAAR